MDCRSEAETRRLEGRVMRDTNSLDLSVSSSCQPEVTNKSRNYLSQYSLYQIIVIELWEAVVTLRARRSDIPRNQRKDN